MKILYLIRHAKSSWKDESLTDHDRPLNKRGKRDAPFMGQKLHEMGVAVDVLLASTAIRTSKTAKAFAKALNFPEGKITFSKELYLASALRLLEVIQRQGEKRTAVALVGHNPELTELSNLLSDYYLLNIPTAGVVGIQFEVQNWKEVKPKSGKMLFFDYPKRYFPDEPVT